MLLVQDYLQKNGIDALIGEFGIIVANSDNLSILNYSQFNSVKTNPIVQECRGLVLDNEFNLIARAFPRFFNLGELPENDKQFNWNSFSVTEKVDGSLILLYHYNGWRINTRGSFGDGKINGFLDYTWASLVEELLPNNIFDNLNPSYTYVLELCSRYNKVVRDYAKPIVYALTIFNGEQELPLSSTINELSTHQTNSFQLCPTHSFNGLEDLQHFLNARENDDPSFEGFVVRDDKDYRIKIKSKSYFNLHCLKSNGNIFHPRYLLPFVIKGEKDELLTYFPELTDTYINLENFIQNELNKLEKIWEVAQRIENRKEFAQFIMPQTSFACVLFKLLDKKTDLKDEFYKMDKLILDKYAQDMI